MISLRLLLLSLMLPLCVSAAELQDEDAFAPIVALHARLKSGGVTPAMLTDLYLRRIDAIDPDLHAVIEVNPDARMIAQGIKPGTGLLSGLPVLIKDNIDTHDRMLTTAGSFALAGGPAEDDAFIVEKLRKAGAVILGKTNLSEWANFRSTHSTSGWSARGGQTHNPYVLDRDPCGSSSGSGAAVAAGLAAAAIGTETDGSILCPSAANGIVGLKTHLSGWSAAAASCRSAITRTPPARWRAAWPTPPRC